MKWLKRQCIVRGVYGQTNNIDTKGRIETKLKYCYYNL